MSMTLRRFAVAPPSGPRQRAAYREIASANGQPPGQDDIRATFAQRRIANAEPGWWIRRGGGWRQK